MEKTTVQTKAVKKALIAAGYKNLSVTCGRGTSYTWISVDIKDREFTKADDAIIHSIVEKVSGRDVWGKESKNISVDFSFHPFVMGKCQTCGAVGADLNGNVLFPDDIIRTVCRVCGAIVLKEITA